MTLLVPTPPDDESPSRRRPSWRLAGAVLLVVVLGAAAGVGLVALIDPAAGGAPRTAAAPRAVAPQRAALVAIERPVSRAAAATAQARDAGEVPLAGLRHHPTVTDPVVGHVTRKPRRRARTKSVEEAVAEREPTPKAEEPLSDAAIRRELRAFYRPVVTAGAPRPGPGGARAALRSDGTAEPPPGAPDVVVSMIENANRIARLPYRYGGGHAPDFKDDAYDCSGSVSYALAGGGLLSSPLASGPLMSWGDPGYGHWVTIFANEGHTFMEIAGLRFDTSGAGPNGSRWQSGARGGGGYEVRHPPGL